MLISSGCMMHFFILIYFGKESVDISFLDITFPSSTSVTLTCRPAMSAHSFETSYSRVADRYIFFIIFIGFAYEWVNASMITRAKVPTDRVKTWIW